MPSVITCRIMIFTPQCSYRGPSSPFVFFINGDLSGEKAGKEFKISLPFVLRRNIIS